jgi:hypothetical protein
MTRKSVDGLLPKLQQPLPMAAFEKVKFPLPADNSHPLKWMTYW